jgi:hypothetical protein
MRAKETHWSIALVRKSHARGVAADNAAIIFV